MKKHAHTSLCLHAMRQAFSMLEMLLVIAIASFLLLIAIPHISNQKTAKLKQCLTVLTLTCRFVQQSAQASQHNQQIIFDPANNRYIFTKKERQIICPLPEHVSFETKTDVYGPPGNPVQPLKEPCTFPKNTENQTFALTFYPNSNATPGAVYVLDKETSTIGALTCGVSQVSYIRTYLYQGACWQLITPIH